MSTPHNTPDSVLRPAEAARLAGVTTKQLTNWEAAGIFPRRFKLNPDGGPRGAVGYSRCEVAAWIAERKASRIAAE